MKPLLWALLLVLVGAATAQAQSGIGPAQDAAAPAVQGVPWTSLSAPQQRLLGSLQDRWSTLPPLRQQALARGAGRWLAMSPQQRSAAQARFRTWRSLPPGQRALIRQRWRQFQRLPPQQQRAVLQSYRAFNRLPPQERAQLRERWLQASPQQRRQMFEHMRQRRSMGPRFGGPRFLTGPHRW